MFGLFGVFVIIFPGPLPITIADACSCGGFIGGFIDALGIVIGLPWRDGLYHVGCELATPAASRMRKRCILLLDWERAGKGDIVWLRWYPTGFVLFRTSSSACIVVVVILFGSNKPGECNYSTCDVS